jgi:hypothetical protein
VVPVKSPLINGTSLVTCGLSPAGKKSRPTLSPTVSLKTAFAGLFSGLGVAFTQRAHCAPDGSLAPGGRVPNWIAATGEGDPDGGGKADGRGKYKITAAAAVMMTAAWMGQADLAGRINQCPGESGPRDPG